jgi:hypothetical protein
MIAATAYTLQQAVDQLMLLLGQHRTAVNMDWGTAALMVNRGWKHVAVRLLPLQEWMWIERLEVTWGTPMPPNFIRPRRALLSLTGEPPYTEARYVDVREFWTLSDWYRGQVWNAATLFSPIYTIMGERVTNGPPPLAIQPTFYCAPYNLDAPNNPPSGFELPIPRDAGVDVLSGILEYYAMPDDLTDPQALLPLPLEYQNYAIYVALMYAVLKYNPAALSGIGAIVANVENELKETLLRMRKEKREQLGSFVEVLAALTPAQQPQPAEPEPQVKAQNVQGQ